MGIRDPIRQSTSIKTKVKKKIAGKNPKRNAAYEKKKNAKKGRIVTRRRGSVWRQKMNAEYEKRKNVRNVKSGIKKKGEGEILLISV